MAISTDVTVQDFSELISHREVEMRSSTSGSGDGGANSMDPLNREEKNDGARNLSTGVVSVEEIPFQITKNGARKIAELTSDDEYNSLISQRQSLVQKQLESHLSRDEVLRLRLIEWTLECVETSRAGLSLDSLQQIAKTHEIIAARVSRTAEQLEQILEAESAKHRYKRSA